MSLRFDLRPPQYRQAPRRSHVDIGKIFFIIVLVLFLLVSGGVAGYQLFRLHALNVALLDLEGGVASLQIQDSKLAAEVATLKDQIVFYEGVRGLLKDDLPALEFLGALEGSLPGTVWVDHVDLVAGAATVTGSAFSEGDVVVFSNALADARVVSEVVVPVISQSGEGLKRTVRFTMNCKLRDMAALVAASREEGN